MSADSAKTQRKFIDKFELTFPMIADTSKTIISAYEADEVLGVTAKRRTFLIAPDGTIARVWLKVNVEGHAQDVLESTRDLMGQG